MRASSCAGPLYRRDGEFVRRSLAISSQNHAQRWGGRAIRFILCAVLVVCGGLRAQAAVNSVSVHAPSLSNSATINVTSPVHFEATAESDSAITGFVVYVDNQAVYRSFSPLLDAWVAVQPSATHSVYMKAWDATGSLLSTATYWINVTGAAPPTPPPTATRVYPGVNPLGAWTVDNNLHVGGSCNNGSIAPFTNSSDPNTGNSPDAAQGGQHFVLNSQCKYDDSLFFWKDRTTPQMNHTNLIWDFWFYIPAATAASTVQALEFDLFQTVRLSNGVHEFMFGSQCNYASNQWQLYLPGKTRLTWVNTGLSPCQFATGTWHHLTYFLQRVTASGYQQIPAVFSSSSDLNANLRFVTLTIDGRTLYLGGLANSTLSSWSPILGVQHQLDSSRSNATIEEYIDKETVISW
jgi:hypothetical protein